MASKKVLKTKKKKKAFSLLEVIVSLTIMGIAMTIMLNFLILSLQISIFSLARSFVRNEVSSEISLIARDIRNADIILDCGATGPTAYCKFVLDGTTYEWQKCTTDANKLCKDIVNPDGTFSNVFTSSGTVNFTAIQFVRGYTDASSISKQNILVTLTAAHPNASYKIQNIVRQISISTRNY